MIIDDLGVECNTEYAMEQVFAIVDSRYRGGKPLIVTTNLKLDELKHPSDLAHARIYDRILERCASSLPGRTSGRTTLPAPKRRHGLSYHLIIKYFEGSHP